MQSPPKNSLNSLVYEYELFERLLKVKNFEAAEKQYQNILSKIKMLEKAETIDQKVLKEFENRVSKSYQNHFSNKI